MIFKKLQKTSCFIILQTGKALALARKLKKYQKAEEKWYKNYIEHTVLERKRTNSVALLLGGCTRELVILSKSKSNNNVLDREPF